MICDRVLEAEIREAAHHVVTLLARYSESINYPYLVAKANKEARDIIESIGGTQETKEELDRRRSWEGTQKDTSDE